MAREHNEIVVMSGNTHPDLTDAICARLGLKRAQITLYHAGNRETMLCLPDTVRSRNVYIVQTATHTNVNDAIMELLFMCYTCRTSAAKKIVGVLPYLPYSKQTKLFKRGAIASKLLAKMVSRSGFDHIITVDLRHKEVQGFFDIPVDNLRASPFLINHIRETMMENNIDRSEVVMVGRESSSVRKATSYAHRLKVDLAILHGNACIEVDDIDGRSSPPPIRSIEFVPGGDSLPVLTKGDNFRSPLNLVGEVRDKIAIIVDDIIDDVEHFLSAANFLKEQGAKKVHLIATHLLLSRESAALLNQTAAIDQVVVTNTVPHEVQALECPKITTIDIAILLTEAIRRVHNNESLSYLFNDVSMAE